MTKQLFRFTFFLLICVLIPLTATAQTVDIPDPNLRAAIEEFFGYPSGAPITTAHMKRLTELYAPNANISDLTGLEIATNLTRLELGAEYAENRLINSNSVSDLSPLVELTNLTYLGLDNNSMSDISTVAGLTNLTGLDLSDNTISDISAVAALTNLTYLSLSNNTISDISPVAALTNLTRLDINNNTISDISPLANLTNLNALFLQNNTISNISPLAGLTTLTSLQVWNNSISDISPLAELTNLGWLYLSNNAISDLSPLVANTGLGSRDTVNVQGNPLNRESIKTHIPTLQSRGVTVEFDVDISDPNLRAAIEKALGKTSGSTITTADMERLTRLTAEGTNISDLTGLEHAINLTVLNLRFHTISDIAAVSGLTNLTRLNLEDNTISDISPVSGLTNLTELHLSGNPISDTSPVSGLTNLMGLSLSGDTISDISAVSDLTNLTQLYLVGGTISDISPVSRLTNLTRLQLWNNSISDISSVSGLTNLTYLSLSGNSISDLSPLVANTGLGSGDTVNVQGNPLDHASIQTHIPTLQSKGVTVEFDNVITESVNIPDANLRAAIEANLGKASGATITTADMARLTDLRAPNANISNLTGLEFATNLTNLDLSDEYVEAERRYINSNSVSDLSPLSGLTKLRGLWLQRNNISDISPVAGLTNLTGFSLGSNSVSDISAVAELTNLRSLWLQDNNISDISPVVGLTNLTTLHLGTNLISDISTVTGLTNLTFLDLREQSISDISALSGLTKLTSLDLGANSVSDISALAGLTNLTHLSLVINSISDLSALAGLTKLTWLHLWDNSISDLSPLVANTGLGSGDEVYVRTNPLNRASIQTHIPALQSRGVTVEFDNVITESVTIPDSNLRAAIEAALGKASGDTITTGDMAKLTHLEARNANITDLTGLEFAVNLTSLDLSNEYVQAEGGYINSNSVSDLSSISSLTNLRELELAANSISDISALAGLTNLTRLDLQNNSISDISAVAGLTQLEVLILWGNNISDISAVAGLTNLTTLELGFNNISDISPVAGLTNLTTLTLSGDNISDISPVTGLTNLTRLELGGDNISDISPVAGLTNLTALGLQGDSISDISPVAGLTNLTALGLQGDNISDISAVAGLTQLRVLFFFNSNISDLSPLVANTGLGSGDIVNVQRNPLNRASIKTHIPALQSRGVIVNFDNVITEPVNIPDANLRAAIENALGKASGDTITTVDMANLTRLEARNVNISDFTGLEFATHLTWLELRHNDITDVLALVAVLSDLPNLTELGFGGNKITDISPLAGLTNLTELHLSDNNISDLSPLVKNTGLGEGDTVDVSENPLNYASINTHIPTLQGRGVAVRFENLKPMILEHLLSIPADISLIHLPLKVTAVDGVPKTITSVGALYDTLGGAENVNFLVIHDSQAQEWHSYLGASGKGTPADAILTDDTGVVASMKGPVSVRLSGAPLGTGGTSTITLHPGLNVVGLPLNDSTINRVSDLLALDGIKDNVPMIILSDTGDFKTVRRAGDPGDIEVTGGQAFILRAQQAATVAISGEGWTNVSGTTAAPLVRNADLHSLLQRDMTPVLVLRGAIVDEATHSKVRGFRVNVKNLSTGRAVTGMTKAEGVGYQLTVVEVETGRAAQIGDILEISAHSPNPFIGVEPLQYTITAEDVKRSLIQLPELVVYEIPAETELLRNYPNPFNPETWIPYRLAEDAHVTLTIYDLTGQVVRTLEVGHQVAAVYERRSKAAYWDGRNDLGERVASGVYFYQLQAGSASFLRKMVVLK